MKQILFIFIALCCTIPAAGQKWFKKARKTQLNVITYDAQGQLLASTNGVYINANGTALSDYDAFKGAARAVVIDESGKEFPVECIVGADAMFNVVTFRVSTKKAAALPLASKSLTIGAAAYIMPYVSSKANVTNATTISAAEKHDNKYDYYTLPIRTEDKSISCPVVNEDGELLGILQPSVKKENEKSFVISAQYVSQLHTNALSARNAEYRDILIRKQLPEDAEQASSFIYLCGTQDTSLYLDYVADFIKAFPNRTEGYTMKAEMLAAYQRYNEANDSWNAGIKAKCAEDELRYSKARTIFGQVQTGRQLPDDWTLENALTEADKAFAINPLPVYTALLGHILYAQKRYDEACGKFLAVNETNMRSAEYFLYAAQCRQIQADTLGTLALQDSAVACFTQPYRIEAATSLLMRAQTLLVLERYREAVADLNSYERLKLNDLTANFYYQREQAEINCRMFQQALNDIERAARMEPSEPLYQAEMSSLYYRFGYIDQAVTAAQAAIALDDTFADAHRILGVCYRSQGKTAEARAALERAAQLGDTRAETLLQEL